MPITDSIATPLIFRRTQTSPQQSEKAAKTEREETGVGQTDSIKS